MALKHEAIEQVASTLPPSSARKQALIDFAQAELLRYRSGEELLISTNEELRAQFGYTDRTSVITNLRTDGILKERRRIFDEIERKTIEEIIIPSRDWAWMLAVLSMGGYVHHMGKIVLSNAREEELQKAFISVGQGLFGVNSKQGFTNKNGLKYPRPEFSSVKVAHAIGDLRRTHWPNTIREKHTWVFGRTEYMWGFLEGVFDTHGGTEFPSKEHGGGRIRINTIYSEVTSFLTDLFTRVDIENPYIEPSNRTGTGILGIDITYLKEIKLFADNIHSKIQRKEEELEFYRRKIPRRPPRQPLSNEEVIQEWVKIKQILGHAPSWNEAMELRKQGLITRSPHTYAKRFGKTDNKSERSFILARNNLERITFPQVINTFLEEKGMQVRYVPKINHLADEIAKRRLEEILGRSIATAQARVLVGPNEQILYTATTY